HPDLGAVEPYSERWLRFLPFRRDPRVMYRQGHGIQIRPTVDFVPQPPHVERLEGSWCLPRFERHIAWLVWLPHWAPDRSPDFKLTSKLHNGPISDGERLFVGNLALGI